MSMNNGGQAFPSTITDDSLHVGGMSLRDYFAAKAMQGLMASPSDPASLEIAAEWSYKVADALLKEREVIR